MSNADVVVEMKTVSEMALDCGARVTQSKHEAVAPMILWVRLGSVVCMMPFPPTSHRFCGTGTLLSNYLNLSSELWQPCLPYADDINL